MSRRLEGKVALVTGAGRGIGRATAIKLAAEGARLVINDLDEEPAAQTADAIRRAGGECVIVAGDVTDKAFPDRFIETATHGFGGLDIIVNNAGYTWDNVVQKMSDDQWQAVIDVHLTAPFRILRAAQPVIKGLVAAERANGQRVMRRVINISSIAGLFGSAGQSNYATAKAGIIAFTQTMAKEWGRYDTTVNCVAYGVISTRIAADISQGETVLIDGQTIPIGINSDVLARIESAIPLGRSGTPEEAAGAIFLFTLPESDYVSGQTLLCSGGYTGL